MRKLDIVASRAYNDGGKKIECGQILGSLYIGEDTDAIALLASIQYGPLSLIEDDEPEDDDDEPADPADDDDEPADPADDDDEPADPADEGENWYEGSDDDSDDDQSQLDIAGDDADLAVVILQADPKVPARILESLAAVKLVTVGDAKKYWAENNTFNALDDIGDKTSEKLVAILSLTDPDDNESSGSDDE